MERFHLPMGWISPQHSPPHCWQDISRQDMLGWNHHPPRIVHVPPPAPSGRIPEALDLAWSPRRTKNKRGNGTTKPKDLQKKTTNLPGKKKVGRQLFCYGARHLFMPLLLSIWRGRYHLEKQFQCQGLKSVSDKFAIWPFPFVFSLIQTTKNTPPKTNGWNLKIHLGKGETSAIFTNFRVPNRLVSGLYPYTGSTSRLKNSRKDFSWIHFPARRF